MTSFFLGLAAGMVVGYVLVVLIICFGGPSTVEGERPGLCATPEKPLLLAHGVLDENPGAPKVYALWNPKDLLHGRIEHSERDIASSQCSGHDVIIRVVGVGTGRTREEVKARRSIAGEPSQKGETP